VATKARRDGEEDRESGTAVGLSLAARENERGQWGPVWWSKEWWAKGGGVGGVTRGTAMEEGPGRRLRPDHGGYGQHAAEHVTSREMSERES
jgi:hypothetical protein